MIGAIAGDVIGSVHEGARPQENGSAMRVAAIGWAFDDLDVVLRRAAESAEPTHNHPEGIKGAQAVAAAILVARTGRGKDHVAALLSERFGYDCTIRLCSVRRRGGFDAFAREYGVPVTRDLSSGLDGSG